MKTHHTPTRNSNSNSVTVVTPEVMNTMPELAESDSADAAERIRFHIHEAQAHGRCAIAHIIEAGWELALQKQLMGFGQWNAWCEEKLSVSRRTADKYIDAYQRTVGAFRASQRIPLDKKLLKKELEAATVGMEEKTARQAMIEMGIVKPTAGHGGKREGAGRKASGDSVAAQLDAIAKNETLIWAELKGALDTLVRLDAEKDAWRRLSDDHLSQAVAILAEVAKKSSETMMGRLGQ